MFPPRRDGSEQIRISSDLAAILIAGLDRKSTDRKTRQRSSRPDPRDQEDLRLAGCGVHLSFWELRSTAANPLTRAPSRASQPPPSAHRSGTEQGALGSPTLGSGRARRATRARAALSHSPRPNPYLRVLDARATALARISPSDRRLTPRPEPLPPSLSGRDERIHRRRGTSNPARRPRGRQTPRARPARGASHLPVRRPSPPPTAIGVSTASDREPATRSTNVSSAR